MGKGTTPATTTAPGSAPTPATVASNYYVTLGIEANHPGGFDGKTAFIMVDPGHAFFSLAKDDKIMFWFSFGPGQDMRTHGSTVLGNIRHGIGESSKHFRIKISKKVADELNKNCVDFELRVQSGQQKYDVTNNDTCASMAIETLTKSGVKVPNGKSPVDAGNAGFIAGTATFLFDFKNPYKWLQQLTQKYSHLRPYVHAPGGVIDSNDPFKKIASPWILRTGDNDPFYGRRTHEDQS